MIVPPFLQAGDTVGIVAPARWVEEKQLRDAIALLGRAGFVVRLGKHIYNKSRIFAGDDAIRATDMLDMLLDPEIKAILCARGGYGTGRIVDLIPKSQMQAHPKWIVGYSDWTVMLLAWNHAGIASIHAPVVTQLTKHSPDVVIKLLKGEIPALVATDTHPLNRHGTAEGRLIGGNLTLLQNSIGTPAQPNTRGSILLLEEIEEQHYRIDRMMLHLKRVGMLEPLAGFAVGAFTDLIPNDPPFELEFQEIIRYYTTEYDYPVGFGLPFGHEAPNLPWIMGYPYVLEVSETFVELRPQSSELSP